MPPSRTTKHNTQTHASSSKSKLDGGRKHGAAHRKNQANRDANIQSVPGVQKIKAALRQTRRLLAKDKLAADVRVETERRLKALEADLAKAERARKERTMAQRYHKVKFFERQKVTRKLNQVKRELEACIDKKEKKKLENALFELRVDLNYILHYPKLKKYISLFPPEARQKGNEKGKGKEMSTEEQAKEKAATDLQREEIRQQVRQQMENGQLSNEPELEELGARKRHALDVENMAGSAKGGKNAGRDVGAAKSSGPKRVPEIQQDEFFGDESEDEGADDGDSEDEMDED